MLCALFQSIHLGFNYTQTSYTESHNRHCKSPLKTYRNCSLHSRITAKIDDDMISYYCNEDLFLLEVRQVEEDLYDITFSELPNH